MHLALFGLIFAKKLIISLLLIPYMLQICGLWSGGLVEPLRLRFVTTNIGFRIRNTKLLAYSGLQECIFCRAVVTNELKQLRFAKGSFNIQHSMSVTA